MRHSGEMSLTEHFFVGAKLFKSVNVNVVKCFCVDAVYLSICLFQRQKVQTTNAKGAHGPSAL